ncbi:MAG: SCP2 sterol-binding domain-containing protein, partial [Actinobacteria bacterium]|nr:SCP2 sterol-binding domain-containing protein [Actinomycetota bacterium]
AKEVFVSNNPQAGMQAFMAGKVKVQGDMAKLMASQQQGGNPKLQEAIQAATE